MSGRIVLLLIVSAICLHADDGTTWSGAVNGLRGRLIIPAHQDLQNDKRMRVDLELSDSSLVDGYLHIPYTPDCLHVRFWDETGKEIKTVAPIYDEISPIPEPIVIPCGSTLRFRVNHFGAGWSSLIWAVIDLGSNATLSILNNSPHTYFVSGTLEIPVNQKQPRDWHGVLELPKVPVPKQP